MFSKKLWIWSFHVVVLQGMTNKCTKMYNTFVYNEAENYIQTISLGQDITNTSIESYITCIKLCLFLSKFIQLTTLYLLSYTNHIQTISVNMLCLHPSKSQLYTSCLAYFAFVHSDNHSCLDPCTTSQCIHPNPFDKDWDTLTFGQKITVRPFAYVKHLVYAYKLSQL